MTLTVCTSADQVRDLPRGTEFRISTPRKMSWNEKHRVLYYLANKPVTIWLRDGRKIQGTLDETPGYFAANRRVWLRVPGRKTRMGVPAEFIGKVRGFRAPTLAEALTSFVILNAGNPAEEDVREALSVARDM